MKTAANIAFLVFMITVLIALIGIVDEEVRGQ